MTPFRSERISLSDFPVSLLIYGMSTAAFSPMDTERASIAVSTCVTASALLIVLFEKISALPIYFPSLSSFSREQRRG